MAWRLDEPGLVPRLVRLPETTRRGLETAVTRAGFDQGVWYVWFSTRSDLAATGRLSSVDLLVQSVEPHRSREMPSATITGRVRDRFVYVEMKHLWMPEHWLTSADQLKLYEQQARRPARDDLARRLQMLLTEFGRQSRPSEVESRGERLGYPVEPRTSPVNVGSYFETLVGSLRALWSVAATNRTISELSWAAHGRPERKTDLIVPVEVRAGGKGVLVGFEPLTAAQWIRDLHHRHGGVSGILLMPAEPSSPMGRTASRETPAPSETQESLLSSMLGRVAHVEGDRFTVVLSDTEGNHRLAIFDIDDLPRRERHLLDSDAEVIVTEHRLQTPEGPSRITRIRLSESEGDIRRQLGTGPSEHDYETARRLIANAADD